MALITVVCVFLLTKKLPVFVVLYISGSCIRPLIDISLNQDYFNVFYVSLQGKESSTSALIGCSAFRVFFFLYCPQVVVTEHITVVNSPVVFGERCLNYLLLCTHELLYWVHCCFLVDQSLKVAPVTSIKKSLRL